MAVSKRIVNDPDKSKQIVDLFLSPDLPTIQDLAKQVGTTHHTVSFVLKRDLDSETFKAHKAYRYSRSKAGDLNPSKGKTREKSPRWKGHCPDGYGYITELDTDGRRRFKHRIVMARALGLKTLPRKFHVHHIDGDPTNNDLDNLALCTAKAHGAIHDLQQDTVTSRLKRSSLALVLESMT